MRIVMKFGGTSVASWENIQRIAELIAHHTSQGNKIVAVISALDGITEKLSAASELAEKGNKEFIFPFKQEMLDKHLKLAEKTVQNPQILEEIQQIITSTMDELEKVLTGITYVGELTPRSRDYILSFGERLSTPIIYGALKNRGLKACLHTGAEAGIVTDSNFGEANPLMNVTKLQVRDRLEPLLEKGFVPVVTGFIAATQDGITTTLGRGGSDYTATIIGAALDAEEVWIWTDVDGLMTSDPKIVPDARTLPELSFKEALEMAVFGAKAMHPRALEPIMDGNTIVRIKNIFNPEGPETVLTKEQRTQPGTTVKAVTMLKDVALINVSGAGMVGAPGTAAKVFDVLGKNKINILMISQGASEANISIIVRRNVLEKAVNALEVAFLGKGLISEITAEDDVCIISAVGAGMKSTPGIASRIFTAVARKGINVRMIAQGSSELNISFVVKEADGKAAVQAVHEEFKLGKY
ncbi:MAG: aspartate kinase [Nitrososphaerota archaeon]|nr:aspartate kinase [Candidatus Bathyarchaeota archaeon]MDW8022320.1 aspartate kinase [Nitrososphaerota archaeon]